MKGSYDEIEAEIRRLLVAAKPGIQAAGGQPPRRRRLRRPVSPRTPASRTRPTSAPSDASRARSRSKGDWQTDRQYVELQKGTGEIVLPFTAGEVNLVMQPGPSGSAAVTVLLDGKPVGDARGADVGTDGVARFDRSGMIRLVAGAPRGKHVLTLVLERSRAARVCVHLRPLMDGCTTSTAGLVAIEPIGVRSLAGVVAEIRVECSVLMPMVPVNASSIV